MTAAPHRKPNPSLHSSSFQVKTKGFCDILDITSSTIEMVRTSGIRDGIVNLFVPGSTASLTTIEYETGAIQDLRRAIEKLVPTSETYQHDKRWGDGNGFAHVRAALLGPSVTIPLTGGDLSLGTWQQIVLIDFDNRPRERKVLVQILGG